ncbi:MAG: hypothetical protein GX862_02920, partial [Leucobacter sp.]|nr:hypothetical protein [Leucobacter sp.]
MFKRLFTAGSGALLVLALSGCAFANSVPKETLEGYFGAIATQDPESKLAAQAFAVPGSLADAYAIEQSAHTQAQLDGGVLSTETNEIVVEAERVLLCEPLAESVKKELDVEDYCSVYENFEFQDDKLVSFNAGPKPLEGRLTLGDSTVIDIGDIGSVEMLASYITIRGDLVVVAEVVSNTDTLRLPYDA